MADYQVHKDFITKKEVQEPTSNLYIFALAVIFLLFTLGVIALNYQSKQLKEQDTTITQEAIEKVAVIPTEAETVYYNIPLEEEWQDLVFDLAERYSVPCEIVFGVMHVESKFDFMAVSSDKACVGIMQINRINFGTLQDELGITDLKNPAENIESGIYILSGLYQKYEDWDKALVCYNCGERGARDIISSRYSREVVEFSSKLEVQQ